MLEILKKKYNIDIDIENTTMVIGMIGILVVMIIPMPTFVMDILLSISITLSVIVLITCMYVLKPTEFFIFPSLLLVMTLFRLSLNVATTRLILLYADAGQVIRAFGDFVIGGNYIVGLIIFIILVAINFIVITKGATRIAEVAARFTLDGMPGRQMAIDADLNAGLIDEPTARRRRKEIAKESEFHGAMDGASKFVRGDAVAGIVITFINIIGGFIIGVFQQDMSAGTAAQTYTILTVGDGLVSQIPSLIIATATGLLVSRAGSDDSMGIEFKKQLFTNTKAVYMGAGVIFAFGLIPGLPHLPFLSLGILLAGSVYMVTRETPEKEEEKAEEIAAEEAAQREAITDDGPEAVEHLLSVDPMELEVGYGIIPLVDKGQDGELLDRIRSIRRQFAIEMGMVIPPIHIRDNLKLKPSEYRVNIKNSEVGRYELMMNHLLAMDPGDISNKLEGIETKEPAFDLPAIWIPSNQREEAKFAGYTVVDNSSVMATHITSIIRMHADELLGRQDVQHLLDNLGKSYPKVIDDLDTKVLPLGIIQKVLQNLVKEGVSIRNLLTIVETLIDFAGMTRDPELLSEYVRQKLARSIVTPHLSEDGTLPVVTLAQDVEEILVNSIQHTEHGSYLSVDPTVANAIMESVGRETENVMAMGFQPIILCSPALRRHFRKMVEQFAPSLMVFSQAELLNNMRFKSLGKVRLKYEG
ncbi:flagellar biosynthesis protein FlhA [Candidatus Magnetomorum sp. HK-1]|nr:flagellar biosynthesis protein FlhA [Candidatus Magnetomorum sp. HK-1]